MDRASIRQLILDDPSLVLADGDVMRALIATQDNSDGRVVDLRGVLLERLEGRLGALETTHRNVIAAAYDNLSGTQQVQRAVLAILGPTDFAGFLETMARDVSDILAVDNVRLALELTEDEWRMAQAPGIVALPIHGIARYIGEHPDRETGRITLRPTGPHAAAVFEEETLRIRSEALMHLDIGEGRRQAMLVFGSTEADRFAPDQGTDLLEFFTGCFERAVRRWLA